MPSDADIRRILMERVDTQRQSVGIVVGVIEPAGRRIVVYGRRAANDAAPLDGDTVFEIGSISKVFTALLLADAVERKEVALDDPVSRYLPATVKVPERGRPITLRDLATHTSALPRLPDNMKPKDGANPYADYSVEQMYEFLGRVRLARDVGSQYEYSNLGAGLLGHLLARRAGMEYETLVKTRVTDPLNMTNTAVTLSPALQTRLTPGHDQSLARVKNWDLPTLAGAGALRSTANDMLTFLAAAMGSTPSPLASAFAMTTRERRPSGSPGLEIGLGWHINTAPSGRQFIWHNGGTGGYRSFTAFDPVARTGVVVLSNTSTTTGPDDIGRHLLDSRSPLMKFAAPKTHTAIEMDPKQFDRYVGRYQFAPAVFLTVSREGSRFLAQLTGQQAFDIFPESERYFFLKVVDAQLTFEVDAQGRSVAVVLHQNGANQRATRVP
jgi:CubicO group peptidase (beta-lactamase class C family)